MKLKQFLLAAALTLAIAGPTAIAQTNQTITVESTKDHDARMAWWREARFGMFIHWGLYSVPAGEWNGKTSYAEWFLQETKMPVSQYEQFARQFNPVKFDARAWVKTAKDAGMKYIVITSKHHDGFCLWPSALTHWDVESTPFRRDPLKELSDACRATGIRFCVYYSIMDWHHSDWGTRREWNDVATGAPDMDRYVAYMKGQLKELITRYHPAVLWFDGEWESPWTPERGVDLFNYLRALDPHLIINNRVGKSRGGMEGMNIGNEHVGDFGTPEQRIPPSGFGPGVDWESCMTLNGHWGYNKHDNEWKSAQTVIRNLCEIASKGGNYLLNVGPTSEGVIPQPAVDTLAEVGAWLKVNGEAIYRTTASPFKQQLGWGRCTQKDGRLYLSVFDWPADGKLHLPLLNKQVKALLLADPQQPLKCSNDTTGLVIHLPPTAPDINASVVAVEIAGGLLLAASDSESTDPWAVPGAVDPSVPMKRSDTNALQLHESFLKRGQGGPIGVLFIGDSITAAWRATWAQGTWTNYFGKYDPANFGIGSDATQHVLWRITHGELDGISPKVIVLLLGTNNIKKNSPADIAEADAKIVKLIREKLPHTKVLLLGIFPRMHKTDPPEMKVPERVKAVNAQLAKLDDGVNVRYLDLAAQLAPGGKVTPEIYADGVHLKGTGMRIWAESITPLLQEMMN
jgi:alpha-L-fucosidase